MRIGPTHCFPRFIRQVRKFTNLRFLSRIGSIKPRAKSTRMRVHEFGHGVALRLRAACAPTPNWSFTQAAPVFAVQRIARVSAIAKLVKAMRRLGRDVTASDLFDVGEDL
jgi:hypothetical protein